QCFGKQLIIVHLASQVSEIFQVAKSKRVVKFKISFDSVPVFCFLSFTQGREELLDKILIVVKRFLNQALSSLVVLLHEVNFAEFGQHFYILGVIYTEEFLIQTS